MLTATRNDSHSLQQTELQMAQEELLNLMTILYVSIQATLNEPADMAESKKQFRTSRSHPTLKTSSLTGAVSLEPSLPTFLIVATSKLRWDDGGFLPQAQVWTPVFYAMSIPASNGRAAVPPVLEVYPPSTGRYRRTSRGEASNERDAGRWQGKGHHFGLSVGLSRLPPGDNLQVSSVHPAPLTNPSGSGKHLASPPSP